MGNRRFAFAVALLLLAVGLWWWGRPSAPSPQTSGSPAASAPASASTAAFPTATPGTAPAAPAATTVRPPVLTDGGPVPDSALIAEPPFEHIELLNAPGRTVQQDLSLLNDLFASWQTTFPRQGNPVGNNDEITTTLTGRNALRYAMIPRNHPAINAQGELVDRWGTPFQFHQISGAKMEIRSAGPDRKLYTADDAVFTP